MLQLIGWLGCLYLFVKALELSGDDSRRNEHKEMNFSTLLAVWLAIIGAGGFALMLYLQGERIPEVL